MPVLPGKARWPHTRLPQTYASRSVTESTGLLKSAAAKLVLFQVKCMYVIKAISGASFDHFRGLM